MSFLAAIATGLLLWAAFPPVGAEAAAWLALAPLLWALWSNQGDRTPCGLEVPNSIPSDRLPPGPRPRPAWWRPNRVAGAFGHGYLAGVVFFGANLAWLRHVTLPGMAMLALYLAIYPALWAVFAATVGRPRRWDSAREVLVAALLTAAAWAGLEWLRGIALTGFGWNGLAVSLDDSATARALSQWAEWIGVAGVSFVIAGISAGTVALVIAMLRARAAARPVAHFVQALAATALALALTLGIGEFRRRTIAAAQDHSRPLTVALIQPNIPQETKNEYESFEPIARTLAQLTQAAFDSNPRPDLVVWPESSLPAPFYFEGVQDVLRQGLTLGDFVHVLGIDDQELDAYFNSIAVFRGDPLQADLHHKVHLVPFGEYLPARGFFGRFEAIRAQLPGDFKPGTSTQPLPMPRPSNGPPRAPSPQPSSGSPAPPLPTGPRPPGVPPPSPASLIPLVCFEDTIGRVARQFARPEPQLIVNVTNDAWFLDSAGPDQHLANARYRAIELRRPMVRAANTGVTAVIDTTGRITHRLPRLQSAQLKTSLPSPTSATLTVYARFGDAFAIGLFVVGILFAGLRAWTGRRASPPAP